MWWVRYYWAAACGGEDGILQLLQQLTAEVKLCMQQLGVSQLRQLNPRRGGARGRAPGRMNGLWGLGRKMDIAAILDVFEFC